MPLHLLQKKSWHVYNTENVERVRRDEVDAQAREDAADQRMLEHDAERRMKLLRGEHVPPLIETEAIPDAHTSAQERQGRRRDDASHDRKRRRRRGEDDTDRDIRVAREQDAREYGRAKRHTLLQDKERDAPLQDATGHIQLIPPRLEQTDGDTSEKPRKPNTDEVQPMRFSDAAGYNRGTEKPWYASQADKSSLVPRDRTDMTLAAVEARDAFGNEDPRRKERESQRITSNDPLMFMQQAQRVLKQSERDKQAWEESRMASLMQQSRKHRSERPRLRESDEIEPLSLDGGSQMHARSHRDGDRKHRHRHRSHRHRSRSRSPREEREGSRQRGDRRRD